MDHNILLKKLEHYGITGATSSNSTLLMEKKAVIIGLDHSNVQIVACGVPQGSLFGPLLFLTLSMIFTSPLHMSNFISLQMIHVFSTPKKTCTC